MDARTRAAITHTLHCLLGCSIGEISGMSLATWLGWPVVAKVFFSVPLAFFFGYLLTSWSFVRRGTTWTAAIKVAIGTDTASIFTMEIVDSAFLLFIPGATSAGLGEPLYWAKLLASLAVAFVVTVPVNRALIGPEVAHEHMHHS